MVGGEDLQARQPPGPSGHELVGGDSGDARVEGRGDLVGVRGAQALGRPALARMAYVPRVPDVSEPYRSIAVACVMLSALATASGVYVQCHGSRGTSSTKA